MQALVLAGGEGTRLRPLTLALRKPVLPLADRPFIRHLVEWLLRNDIGEIVIACGPRSDDVRAALVGVSEAEISYLEEPEPLGTAGPLRLAADRGLLGERFLALNGDVLTDLALLDLVRAHEDREAVATIALHPVEDVSGYGLVRRDEDGRVRGFIEKPGPEEIDTDEINAGAYVLERAMVDLVPPGRPVSIEREVFPRLVGQGLYGDRLEGYWMDIGTPERLLTATWDILEGRIETACPPRENAILIDPRALVDEGAVVGPHAVIGPGSRIGERSIVSGSVLVADCRIGKGCEVWGSILAPGVEVGDGARITAGAVIGEGARIDPGAELLPGARVGPRGLA